MSRRSLTFKTLVLASGRALTALSAILATAILTRALTKADYATHKQALLVYAMAAPLLMLGLPKALYVFLPRHPERARAALVSNLLLLLGGGAVLTLALLLGLGDLAAERFDNPRLSEAVWLVGPYALAMFPLAALGAVMVAQERVTTLLRFNIASRAILLGLVALAGGAVGSAWATVGAYALWAAVMVVPAIVLMLRAVPPDPDGGRPTVSGMKRQLAFSVPLGLAGMLGTLSTQLDKLIVSAMCTVDDFAIYVTGAIELPLIGVVTGAMSAVVLPELSRFYAEGTPGRIIALWQKAMNKALLVLAPVMFGVLLAGPELMAVVFSADYTAAAEPLRIYALMLPLRAAVYGSVLMATDRTRWVTASAGFGLALNAGLSVVLVGALGYAGAAWATVLTTYGVVAFMLWPMSRALECRPWALIAWGHVARVLLVAGLPAAALWAVDATVGVPLGDLGRLVVLGGGYGLLVAGAYQLSGVTTVADLLRFLQRRSG